MLWYHDHAMGTSRLNLYAGLMGVYLLRDDHEDRLDLPAGSYELPLILYDRIFDHESQLSDPVSPYSKASLHNTRWPAMPWWCTGRVQPFHEVEPRRYRLRLLNAANGRFFRLQLSNGAGFLQIGVDRSHRSPPR